jgi:hypothetical protein
VPGPQVFIQTARWHSTCAELHQLHLNCTVVAWVGCGGTVSWPPRLLDLDFSVGAYVKHKVFLPHLPASLEELRAQITEPVATIDADMIHRIWDEITYRWDICHVT